MNFSHISALNFILVYNQIGITFYYSILLNFDKFFLFFWPSDECFSGLCFWGFKFQAYQVELEALAVKLEEENEQLLKEKVMHHLI